MIKIKSKIGKRGEIYTTKELREVLGIKEGDEITMRIENNNLIIEKGDSLVDMLDLPPLAEETVEEIEESLDKIRIEVENQSVEDYENNT